jgi:hypothetical protein
MCRCSFVQGCLCDIVVCDVFFVESLPVCPFQEEQEAVEPERKEEQDEKDADADDV